LYQSFYNLKEQPFQLTPDPSFMCMTEQHQEALAGLVYSACARPGLLVLTGEAGTGKTTLLYALLDLLEKRRFVTAVCTNPILTQEELFDFLMLEFEIDCPSNLKSRRLAALEQKLMRNRTEGRPSVLIVDEAHRLSLELLEEIRLLLNLETPREKLLQIIIAGQPELISILQRPDLRQFKQRISCQCKLNPLTPVELKEYIGHRMAHAGVQHQTIFPDAVIQRIHEYTEGIPRLVNCLCDNALRTGFALHSAQITPAIVDEAAKDLDLTRPGSLDALPSEPVAAAMFLRHTNGHASLSGLDRYANEGSEQRMPMESYSTRQKSINFFAQLIDRWR
jgi:general secretion pathway protein A